MESMSSPTAEIVHGPVTHTAPHLYGKPPKAGSQSDSLSFHLVYDDVMVPMRDAVELAGDLYIPAVNNVIDTSRRWPCVLIRTPYDKSKINPDLRNPGVYWTQNGYCCFVQDCRGRFKSQGVFYKYTGEAADGYDTVEWLAVQSWCNGSIVTDGPSYLCVDPSVHVWLVDGSERRADQLLPTDRLLDELGQSISIVPNTLIGTVAFPQPAPGQAGFAAGSLLPTPGAPPGALTINPGWQAKRRIAAVLDGFDPFIVSRNHPLTVGTSRVAKLGGGSAVIKRAAALHFPSDCLWQAGQAPAASVGQPIPGYFLSKRQRGGHCNIRPYYWDGGVHPVTGVVLLGGQANGHYRDPRAGPLPAGGWPSWQAAATQQVADWNAIHSLPAQTRLGQFSVSAIEAMPPSIRGRDTTNGGYRAKISLVKLSVPVVFPVSQYVVSKLDLAMLDVGLNSGVVDGVSYVQSAFPRVLFRAAQLERALRLSAHGVFTFNDAAAVAARAVMTEQNYRDPANGHQAVFPPTSAALGALASRTARVQELVDYMLEVTAWVAGLWLSDGDSQGQQIAQMLQSQLGIDSGIANDHSGVFLRCAHWVELLGLPASHCCVAPNGVTASYLVFHQWIGGEGMPIGLSNILRNFLVRCGVVVQAVFPSGITAEQRKAACSAAAALNKPRFWEPGLLNRSGWQTETVRTRRALLAGLIDGEGTRQQQSDQYAFVQDGQHGYPELVEWVSVLFRQLGWRTGSPALQTDGQFLLQSIQHHFSEQRLLPLAIDHKRTVGVGQRLLSPHHCGFRILTTDEQGVPLVTGPVVSFQVQGGTGNGRFLLADGTITHNCHVQTSMALLRPPHLRAMMCNKGGFYNAHTSGVRQGGAYEARQWVWGVKNASRKEPRVREALEAVEKQFDGWMRRYPFVRGDSPLVVSPEYESYIFDQAERAEYGDYWKQVGLNTEEHLQDFHDIPCLFLSGWYDIYARSTIDFFTHLSPIKKGPMLLIMGPWQHVGAEGHVAGEVDFGVNALVSGNLAPNMFSLSRRWFDRWVEPASVPQPRKMTPEEKLQLAIQAAEEQQGRQVSGSSSPSPTHHNPPPTPGSLMVTTHPRGPYTSLSHFSSSTPHSSPPPLPLTSGPSIYIPPSMMPRERSEPSLPLPPPVRYFRMGGGDGHRTSQGNMFHGGVWMQAASWPPAGTKTVSFLLGRRSLEEARGDRDKADKDKAGAGAGAGEKDDGKEASKQMLSGGERAAGSRAGMGMGMGRSVSAGGNRGEGAVERGRIGQQRDAWTERHDADSDEHHGSSASTGPSAPPVGELPPPGLLHQLDHSTTFHYDPRHPCPSIGGNVFGYRNILMAGAYDQHERSDHFLCSPPYLPLSSRRDVIVFRTPPLQSKLDVTGTPTAVLYVSSTAVDTDFTVKLIDEYPASMDYPHGFAMQVTHGIQRCRYRDSRERAALMQPGRVYRVEVSMYPTSNLFSKGHCLRLDVSSSNFPHFDLNMNTADQFESKRFVVAENTVFHTEAFPSALLLPVQTKTLHHQMAAMEEVGSGQ